MIRFSLYNCENLEEIITFNPTPPSITKSFTSKQYITTKVLVPYGTIERYKQASSWKSFWNIEEMDPVFPNEIILGSEAFELEIGNTYQLTATVKPENTTDKTITWSSSNSAVATVTDEGLVTAISVGSTTITTTCGEVSAECTIIVIAEDDAEDDALTPPSTRIEIVMEDQDATVSVYTMGGVLIKKDCRVEDLKTLAKGIYIIVSGKESYKISI